ncbi:MAG: hypothetical protein WCO77_06860 [bacterium]
MMTLAGLTITSGMICLGLGFFLAGTPALARQALQAFPRSLWAGGILAAVALAWSAWEANNMTLGVIDAYKSWLWVVGPVLYLLVMFFMNELLAARALGGILMLSASPILELQRVHESSWAVVMGVWAYIIVVAGMVLMLSPFRFRHVCAKFCGTDSLCRRTGLAELVSGILLIALGVLVF